MSIYAESISMNLHEECLLKYLVNPLELFYTTELLKNSNRLIEENFKSEECINAVESGKWKVESC